MEVIRHLTCTKCRWSRWVDNAESVPADEGCPRCGATTVLGRRPDDVYPTTAAPEPARRDSDPIIAVADFPAQSSSP